MENIFTDYTVLELRTKVKTEKYYDMEWQKGKGKLTIPLGPKFTGFLVNYEATISVI